MRVYRYKLPVIIIFQNKNSFCMYFLKSYNNGITKVIDCLSKTKKRLLYNVYIIKLRFQKTINLLLIGKLMKSNKN